MEWVYNNEEDGHSYPRQEEIIKNNKTHLGDGGYPRLQKEEIEGE